MLECMLKNSILNRTMKNEKRRTCVKCKKIVVACKVKIAATKHVKFVLWFPCDQDKREHQQPSNEPMRTSRTSEHEVDRNRMYHSHRSESLYGLLVFWALVNVLSSKRKLSSIITIATVNNQPTAIDMHDKHKQHHFRLNLYPPNDPFGKPSAASIEGGCGTAGTTACVGA